MKFVKTEDLKPGMRLAKPVFNKNGVLLYDRDTKLTGQGVNSIYNFGLIGLYILEQAEPLPPLSEADREFERFQTVAVFKVKDMFAQIRRGKHPTQLGSLTADIIHDYGNLKERMNFMQNLRSVEDNVYKHTINTAILCAAISGKMTLSLKEQNDLVTAALLHDVGSLDIPEKLAVKQKDELTEADIAAIYKYKEEGIRMVRDSVLLTGEVPRIMTHFLSDVRNIEAKKYHIEKNTETLTEILKVAYFYDVLTAMKFGEEPMSDIAAYRYLKHPRNMMNRQVVAALTQAINIAPPGCTVQFENGEKGIVITDNPDDILRPFILSFKDNQIYNLADGRTYQEYQIKDVMKTLDNRYIMTDKFKEYQERLKNGEGQTFKVGKKANKK